jgi:hypothetical protein
MWEPRRLTTLWAFTACYSDSFTFTAVIRISAVLWDVPTCQRNVPPPFSGSKPSKQQVTSHCSFGLRQQISGRPVSCIKGIATGSYRNACTEMDNLEETSSQRENESLSKNKCVVAVPKPPYMCLPLTKLLLQLLNYFPGAVALSLSFSHSDT